MPILGIQRRKRGEMNDNFYIAVSARAILKDGKRKYFLGKDDLRKRQVFYVVEGSRKGIASNPG